MMYGRLTVNPVSAAWNTVARFDEYSSAQRAVDWLSDDGFPVEQLDIVGSDLRLVERVTGPHSARPGCCRPIPADPQSATPPPGHRPRLSLPATSPHTHMITPLIPVTGVVTSLVSLVGTPPPRRQDRADKPEEWQEDANDKNDPMALPDRHNAKSDD